MSPEGVFPPQGEFIHYFFLKPQYTPEHFFLILPPGEWGVCKLQRSKVIKCTCECDLSVDQQLTITSDFVCQCARSEPVNQTVAALNVNSYTKRLKLHTSDLMHMFQDQSGYDP